MFEFAWNGLKGPGEKVLLATQKNDYTKLAITYTEDSISLKKMSGEEVFNYPRYALGLVVTGVAALTVPFGFVAAILWGVMYPVKKWAVDDFTESRCRPYVSFVASEGYKTKETYQIPGIGQFIEQHGKKAFVAEVRNTLETGGISGVNQLLADKMDQKRFPPRQLKEISATKLLPQKKMTN